jgi:capsular exopolysaccharide synthesis family protein
MTRVFEALQRQQERKNKPFDRDPLAAETGAPDENSNTEQPLATEECDLPVVIGSPVASGSNEGMAFPSMKVAANRSSQIHSQSPAKHHSGNGAAEAGPQPESPKQRRETAQKTAAHAPREIPVERLDLSRVHPRLILLTEPDLPECEQYRTLRTQLFHAAEKKQMQIVLVTSALAGEGKTATALNLALAVAQSKEKRVLLIDGDLRRPTIAQYLGLRPLSGFDQALAGGAGALDSIVCLDDLELYILSVNRAVLNPTELLSSERLGETIAELREYFDFVIIDSPPIMPVADSRLLANHSDAVILVVRAGSASYETVEKAIDALPAGRILGVVLNGAQYINETDYYDYYYSYSQRQQRRRTLWAKVTGRIRESWLGRKLDL